jgi:hypothetical protein
MQRLERSMIPLVQHSAAGRHKVERRGNTDVSVPDFHQFSAQYRVFSDTVVFWTADDDLSSFLTIVQASSQLAAAGFGTQMPLRGSIGHGDLLTKPQIIVGEAVEEAYLWEQSQAWAGVSFTPRCEQVCTDRGFFAAREQALLERADAEKDTVTAGKFRREVRRLVRYSVPLQYNPKNGPATYRRQDAFVIDWTLSVFAGAAAKALPEVQSEHATRIRQETIAFEDWARARGGQDL